MDSDTAAATRFWRLVRRFCVQAKPWAQGIVFIDTTPAERMDITKISQRVYGTRHETLAVQAAAGLDQCYAPLEQSNIALPTPAKLMELKRQAGFESVYELRTDGAPSWRDY